MIKIRPHKEREMHKASSLKEAWERQITPPVQPPASPTGRAIIPPAGAAAPVPGQGMDFGRDINALHSTMTYHQQNVAQQIQQNSRSLVEEFNSLLQNSEEYILQQVAGMLGRKNQGDSGALGFTASASTDGEEKDGIGKSLSLNTTLLIILLVLLVVGLGLLVLGLVKIYSIHGLIRGLTPESLGIL
jgi:hypothetical protein